jgi:hypothetical protein
MRTYAVRVLAVLAVLAGWSVGAPTAALASCAGREPAQVVADSDVVLTGRLSAVEVPAGDHAGPGRAPAADGTTLPGSRVVDVGGGGMTLTTMLVIALVGLLVVTFGGLALAIGLGLLTARRRNRSGGSDPGTRPDSTGTPFK